MAKRPRQRQKRCDRCNQLDALLYRVQLDATGQWQFVCDGCWPQVREANPHYLYGGTWKATKR
ncbi:MAG: hypothetical protein AAFY78_19865 [Cyanobacteria bacterium J06648_16]